jgi:hypothetical protein
MTLSVEEKQILDQYNDALLADDLDTAVELAKQLPVPPELARCFDQAFGPDHLKNLGFNITNPEVNHANA